jgi:transposase
MSALAGQEVSAALRATGKMERPPGGRRGPVSKVTPEIEQDLRSWVAGQADLTLAELQLRFYEQRQLEISIGRLWMALRDLGLRLKKVAPRRRAGCRRGPVSGTGAMDYKYSENGLSDRKIN